MDHIEPLFTQILIAVFTAGSVYGAIRSDIKNLLEKAITHKESLDKLERSVERSHERIDEHITVYHRGN